MKKNILLIVILLVASALRLVKLGTVPAGLHADEVSFILNAASILETGKDEDGKFFPLILESVKDSKPALYSYLQIPVFFLMGPTAFASRLPSVILGLISIYLAYILVLKLTKNQRMSLLMAFVLAISPWHIMNSRSTQEVIMSLVFVELTLLLYINILSNWKEDNIHRIKQIPFLKLGALFACAVLAMYSYHSSKILLVLFFSAVTAYTLLQSSFSQKTIKNSIVLGLILVGFGLTATAALTRFNSIGLLSSDLPKAQIFEFTTKATGQTPLLILRVFYNKITMYGLLFLNQYIQHFSPSYFFVEGGITARHVVPLHGLFYLVEAILMALGLYNFIDNNKYKKILPYWLFFVLASPVAAALTTEDIPSSIRPFSLVLPLAFLIVLGIEWILQQTNKKIKVLLLGVIFLGYSWGIGYFLQQFFIIMPNYRPWHRSEDYSITAKVIADIEEKYDRVIITNDLREMYIYLWQEGKISISELQAQPLARYSNEYQIGKYYFNQNYCDISKKTDKTLVVSSPTCDFKSNEGFVLIGETKFRDTTPAFRLFESIPTSKK